MNPEHPSESLLERSLAAWDVPEPAPDLTDRILAHNADAVEALSHPTPESPFDEAEETPAMLPTEPRTSSNLRPFWTATLLGFAAAAALLLAFAAGRQSKPPAPLTPSTPQVEINLTAPVAAPVPTPPAPAPEKVIIEEETTESEPAIAPTPPEPPKVRRRRPRGSSKDLKNPFGDSDDAAVVPELKDPFSGKPGILRIGTMSGVAPAEVYVDGKHVGRTPLAKVELEAGSHTVEFVWPNDKRVTKKVTVSAGGTAIVRGG